MKVGSVEADDVMLSGELIYDGQVVKEYRGDGSVEILGTTCIMVSQITMFQDILWMQILILKIMVI